MGFIVKLELLKRIGSFHIQQIRLFLLILDMLIDDFLDDGLTILGDRPVHLRDNQTRILGRGDCKVLKQINLGGLGVNDLLPIFEGYKLLEPFRLTQGIAAVEDFGDQPLVKHQADLRVLFHFKFGRIDRPGMLTVNGSVFLIIHADVDVAR